MAMTATLVEAINGGGDDFFFRVLIWATDSDSEKEILLQEASLEGKGCV